MSEYKETGQTNKTNKVNISNLSNLNSEEKLILKDKLKNKKLVTILNHKMFKGYRDIKASKWFVNKKPKYISSLAWENKIFDPFDDLYNLDYKSNVLYPLQNPLFNNFLQIKNYPPKDKKRTITSGKNSEYKNYINRIMTGNNTHTQTSSKTFNDNNIYITSNSIYKTNNFYKLNEPPMKIYNQIFDNLEECELYNDIPILAIEKSKNYYLRKNQLSSKKSKKEKSIIQSDNKYDDEFNGLTETQFLYKISHNKTNKHVDENIKTNSFKNNDGLVRGFSARKIKSAKYNYFNQQHPSYGPNGVIIELELDQRGNMTTKRMYTTTRNNKKEEIKVGIKNNNYYVYNFEQNKSKNMSASLQKSKASNVEKNKIFEDNFHSEKKKEPEIRVFENKPRVFDDKFMLQLQLDKKNKFLKLKQLMI